MSNSLWSTPKNIGINLVPIRPSNPLLHPSVHDYPIKKKCFQFYQKPLWVSGFTSSLSKEKKRKKEIYLSRTVLLLTFTFSLISELPRGFAAMPVCCGVKGIFCLFWLVLFFNAIFRFHFVHYHPWSNMHACTFFFFFFDERLVIHPATHSFVVHNYTTYLTFYLIYMQDMCNMRLWLGTQI